MKSDTPRHISRPAGKVSKSCKAARPIIGRVIDREPVKPDKKTITTDSITLAAPKIIAPNIDTIGSAPEALKTKKPTMEPNKANPK